MTGATAQPPVVNDPLVVWVAEWKTCFQRAVELSHHPDGGDGDMPEQVALEKARAELDAKVAKTQAITPEGLAAQLEWLDLDSNGLSCMCSLHTDALRIARKTAAGEIGSGTAAGGPEMRKERITMTREQMHDESLIIESLLETAQAMAAPGNEMDMLLMVNMASARATRLNEALDSVNA